MQLPSNVKCHPIHAHQLASRLVNDAVTSHMLMLLHIFALKTISRSATIQAFYQLDILLQGLIFSMCSEQILMDFQAIKYFSELE